MHDRIDRIQCTHRHPRGTGRGRGGRDHRDPSRTDRRATRCGGGRGAREDPLSDSIVRLHLAGAAHHREPRARGAQEERRLFGPAHRAGHPRRLPADRRSGAPMPRPSDSRARPPRSSAPRSRSRSPSTRPPQAGRSPSSTGRRRSAPASSLAAPARSPRARSPSAPTRSPPPTRAAKRCTACVTRPPMCWPRRSRSCSRT